MYPETTRSSRGGGRFSMGRIVVALVIAAISLISYFASSEFNPITGETQQVALSPNEEIAMGLQAAPGNGTNARWFASR